MELTRIAMERIRYLRRIKDVSQAQAAEGVGVSQQTWSHFESGKRRLDLLVLEKMSNFFKVPADYFITDDQRAKEILSQVITGIAPSRAESPPFTEAPDAIPPRTKPVQRRARRK